MSGTSFSDLIKLCKMLESTSSRVDKVVLLAEFLDRLDEDDIVPAVRIISGEILPEYSGKSLDIGIALVERALKALSNQNLFLERKPMTIMEVYELLVKIAEAEGEGARKRKEKALIALLARLSENEREYLIRSIFGEMRIGVSIGLLLEAIAKMVGTSIDCIKRAYMFTPDIGDLILIAKLKGASGLKNATLSLFKPIRPMLAEMCYSIRDSLRELGGRVAFEYKYDGIRIQVHRKGRKVRIYTRRLSDVTEKIPELTELVLKKTRGEEVILDGELIGYIDKNPVRFQDLMRRFRKKNISRDLRSIELVPYFFDILYYNGRVLVDTPYEERWNILRSVVDEDLLATRIVTGSVKIARDFLEQAEREGHEGIMAKRLDSTYAPGVRAKTWLKIKKAVTLDVVIIGAEWGHGRRRKWLSNYYLAVRDENSGRFLAVGKTFKGLTDEEFEEMTKRLLRLKIRESKRVVWVKPKIVVEVAFNEIQRSPKYRSGYALRFARIVRIRYDKSPNETVTLSELSRIYEEQFKRKARLIK